MSYASSILSSSNTFAVYGKKLAHIGRPEIEILLDDHSEGKVYTTFDALTGRVNITASHTARFDEIAITLEGTTTTYVENLTPSSTRARTTATHNFLKLTMPIRDSDYPQPRVAEAGRTYTFPFNFVIPDQLLPRACSHECDADHVRDAHLQLPPSMGDLLVSLKDDSSADMSKIDYRIKVKVTCSRECDAKNVVLVETSKKFRVVPAVAEAPPLSVGDGYDDYVLSRSKTLRKGMFSGKLGKITISAAQTGALVLPAPASDCTAATIMATLNMRFDPHSENSEPPRLGGLTTKIRSSTCFSTRPSYSLLSSLSVTSHVCDVSRGTFHASIPLSSRCVESVAWVKRIPTQRRNSDCSTSSSDCSDASDPSQNDTKPYYTATILVPISLPSTKAWLPTFHSCVISRLYSLDFILTIHTPGTAVPASTLSLHLPVQIAAEPNQTERAQLTPEEAAAELADAFEFFSPRVIEIPREDLMGNSVLLDMPPTYEEYSAGSMVSVGRY